MIPELMVMGVTVGTYSEFKPGALGMSVDDFKPSEDGKALGLKPASFMTVNFITGQFTGYRKNEDDPAWTTNVKVS